MTEKWVRDTGLVFALLCLFFAYKGSTVALVLAAVLVAAVAFAPKLIWPLAYLWMKVAVVLGFIMPRIFFGIVFFGIITPVGVVRRFFVGDARGLTRDNVHESAFITRNVVVRARDLERPF